MRSSKAMDEWVATLNGWRKSPFEVGQEGLSMAENGLSPEERQAIMDDRDSIGRGDYPKGWGPTPVAPTLTTANLIRYEWHACVPDTERLNALFADGWEFYSTASVGLDGLTADTCILRREPRTGGAAT